jgi:hypothetical protein
MCYVAHVGAMCQPLEENLRDPSVGRRTLSGAELPKLDLLLATSERDRAIFEKELGIDTVEVIPNSIDLSEFIRVGMFQRLNVVIGDENRDRASNFSMSQRLRATRGKPDED